MNQEEANKLLLEAAESGRLEDIKKALDTGADINYHDPEYCGGTALCYAKHYGECVKYLLTNGADVHARNNIGATPLHYAAMSYDSSAFLSMLEAGADIDARDDKGRTPLYYAAAYHSWEILNIYIDKFGYDVNAQYENGETLLHIAAKGAFYDGYDFCSIGELINLGADVNKQDNDGNTPLHIIVKGGRGEWNSYLCGWNDEERVASHHSSLLLSKININSENNNVNTASYDDEDVHVINLLHSGGANIDIKNNDGKTPLDIALDNNDLSVIDLLKAPCYIADTPNDGLLMKGAYMGNLDLMKIAIEGSCDTECANPNIWDKDGNTPLHQVVRRVKDIKSKELISLLINAGADVNVQHKNSGNTPLHKALWMENPPEIIIEICKLLIDAGADMYVENDNGDTPYDIATSDDDLSDIAELMRQKKAAEVNRLIRREPMYQNKVYTLKQLLDWAETGQIAIPNIQRPYVWSPAQLARYVDSLMHGWPCGTLLLWNTDIDNQRIFGTRCFTHLHRLKDAAAPKQEQENTSYTQLILDGQQRLQSLVLAFSARSEGIKATSHEWSRDSGFSRGSSRETERKLLCFNLKNWTQELAEMMPSFYYLDYDENLDDIPCLQWRTEEEISNSGGLLVPLCRIHEYKRTDSVALSWLRGMVDFILEGTQFPVLEVNRVDHTVEDMDDDEAIVQIFTRLNTAGTPLTKEQIQAARINSLWDKFQERIENLKDILRQSPYRVPIGDDDIINGYNITLRAWYREPRINKAYSKAMVKQEWDDIWGLFSHYTRECITALQNKELDFNVEYKSLYIIWFPVAHLCCTDAAKNKRLTISNELESRLEKWVLVTTWAKIWANRSGQYVKTYTDRLVDRDESEATETWLNGILQEESLRKSACDSIDNLAANHRGRVRQYYLPLWAWSRLTEERAKYVLSFGDKPFAIDHIFPVARITDANVKAAYNSLGNCWMLCSDANTKKSDNLFPDFLKSYNTEIEDSIEPLLCTDNFLSAQAASTEYQSFLANREKEIKDSIKKFINDATDILYHPDATNIQYRTYQHNTDGIHRGQDYINMEDFKKLKFKSQQSYLSNIRTGLKDLGISESIANMSTEEVKEYTKKDLKSLIGSKGDSVRRYLQFLLGTDLDGGGRQRNKKVTQPKCEDEAGKCQANKIGQLANSVVRSMLEGGCCGEDEIQQLLDAGYSKQVFNLNYPFLTTGSIRDANGRNRYYATALRINGKMYYLCSQWVEDNHRSRLDQWIKAHQN